MDFGLTQCGAVGTPAASKSASPQCGLPLVGAMEQTSEPLPLPPAGSLCALPSGLTHLGLTQSRIMKVIGIIRFHQLF